MIENVFIRLEKEYKRMIEEEDTPEQIHRSIEFQKSRGMQGWECFFVPERWFYSDVLRLLRPDDVVFDVGAGDLRFDLLMARKVKKVYAVEINPVILGRALKTIGYDLPRNVIAICGNAFEMELPSDVTVITCLMIHREHDFPESWRNRRIIYTRHEGVFVLNLGKMEG